MNPHEPIFVAPPITEIPDYVWTPRYARPSWIPGRPVKKPKDTSKQIPHPDAESALQAAKKACRGNTGRWFGRAPEGPTAFWIYEGNKVVERHVVIGPPIGPPIGLKRNAAIGGEIFQCGSQAAAQQPGTDCV